MATAMAFMASSMWKEDSRCERRANTEEQADEMARGAGDWDIVPVIDHRFIVVAKGILWHLVTVLAAHQVFEETCLRGCILH